MRVDGERSVVRVCAPGDNAAGAGLLLTPDPVATCAHVVAEAAGCDGVPDSAPTETIDVDLPLMEDRPRRRGRVLEWLPPDGDGGGDIAVLKLEDEVSAPVPHLRRRPTLRGRAFHAVGFPGGREDGVTAVGELRDAQGGGWIQLVVGDGPRVESGFSGAPIWDAESGSVVAMAVGADLDRSRRAVAYALPIDRILAVAPHVLTNPYRGLAAFGEDDAEFFFGRDADVTRSLDVLDEHGVVVVAGGSGTGKSSLLRAGIAAAERARGRRPVVARLAGADGEERIVAALAEALSEAEPGDWEAVLRGEAPAPATDLLLLVDQFEDLAAGDQAVAGSAAEVLVSLAATGVRVAVTARWATFDGAVVGDAAAALQRATIGLTVLTETALRQAVAAPADRVPGPSFPSELVDRIIVDAGREPGRLPLVQTLLAKLWDEPDTDGRLTVAAYEKAGGVDRALVESADATWESLEADDRTVAESLLVDMTRPIDGGFVRAPLRLTADLGADRLRVVALLAAARLVTVERGGNGDVAELAHQALIDRWPTLRSWLETDAEFLRWRDGLRAAVGRWTRQRDSGPLLRGAELEVALGWVRGRGAVLSETELALVEASRRNRRRNRVLRTAAVAVLVVLALVAGTLAAVATSSNRDLTRALGTANARTLGRLALDRLAGDPSLATELALAAYRSDPDDPDARSALGQAYLARRSTTATYPVPGGGRNHWIVDDPDSDVAGLSTTAGAVLAEGLNGPSPRFRPIPGSRPETRPVYVLGGGRWIVLTDPSTGTLRAWDRQSSGQPRLLGKGIKSAGVLGGTRLIVPTPVARGGTELRIVDVATGSSTPVGTPVSGAGTVSPTPDPARVLVRNDSADGQTSTLTLRDARSGVVLVTYPPSARPAAAGASVVWCESTGTDTALVVGDTTTGAVRLRVTSAGTMGVGCSSSRPDVVVTGDGRHAAWVAGSSSTVDLVRLVDVTDGRRSSAWVPKSAGLDVQAAAQAPSPLEPPVIGVSKALTVRGDRALVPDADGLSVLALSRTPSWRDAGRVDGSQAVLSQDGTYSYVSRPDAQTTVRTDDGAVLGRLDPAVLAPGEALRGVGLDRSRNVLSLVVSSAGSLRLRELTLPAFRAGGVYDLTAAGAAGLDATGAADPDGSTVVFDSSGDHLAVLAGGTLSWWSLSTHQLLAPPTVVTGDPRTAAELTAENRGGMSVGGQDDDDVAIRLPGEGGGLSVFHLDGSSPTRLPSEQLVVGTSRASLMRKDVLAMLQYPGSLVQHDPATGALLAPPIAVPATTQGFVGTDSDGRFVTVDDDLTQHIHAFEFWDPHATRTAGRLEVPDTTTDPRSSSIVDGRLDIDTRDDLTSITVDAAAWRDQLCRVQDRPFTEAETALLPVGADRSAPCTRS